MRFVAVGLVGTALLLGGCGNESEPGRESSVSPSTQPPSSGPDPTPTPSTPANPVDQAKADLAGRLGVSVEAVTLVSSAEVTWPDASLGCPQPGMHYAQVLTNGTRAILTAAGKQYHYHSSPQRPPFLCESPRPPVGG